jgi:hypothetical protein
VRSTIRLLRGDVGGDAVLALRGGRPATARKSATARGDLTMRGEPGGVDFPSLPAALGDVCAVEVLRCLLDRASTDARSSTLAVERLRELFLGVLRRSLAPLRTAEDCVGDPGASADACGLCTERRSRGRFSTDCPLARGWITGIGDLAAVPG